MAAGTMAGLSLGHAPGTELRGSVNPETLLEEDPTWGDRAKYGFGSVMVSPPAAVVTGGPPPTGTRAAAARQVRVVGVTHRLWRRRTRHGFSGDSVH